MSTHREGNASGHAADPAWAEPMRQELRELVEGPMTPANLKKISSFTKHLQSLAALSTGAPMPRRRVGLFGNYAPEEDEPLDQDGVEADQATELPLPLTPGGPLGTALSAAQSSAETFGARVVREGLAALKHMRLADQIPGLVTALKAAKEAGLQTVAEKLERKIDEALGEEERQQSPPSSDWIPLAGGQVIPGLIRSEPFVPPGGLE